MINEILAHLSTQQYDEARIKINQVLHTAPVAYAHDFDTALILVNHGIVICDTNTAKELWLTKEEQEILPWVQNYIPVEPANYIDKPNLAFYIDPLFPANRILYIDDASQALLKLSTLNRNTSSTT